MERLAAEKRQAVAAEDYDRAAVLKVREAELSRLNPPARATATGAARLAADYARGREMPPRISAWGVLVDNAVWAEVAGQFSDGCR